MIHAKGNGLSECYKCKNEGKYSLTWTSFLYHIKNDEHLYCYECAKTLEIRMVKMEIEEILEIFDLELNYLSRRKEHLLFENINNLKEQSRINEEFKNYVVLIGKLKQEIKRRGGKNV